MKGGTTMTQTVERSFRHIDTIVIIIIVYFLIKWVDSHYILPSWGALCVSGIIGIISYTFLPYKKIGRIIQTIASLFEAYFFATLFPFNSWLKKTSLAILNEYSFIAIITILLFLLIFELHDHGISKTIKNIFKNFHCKKESTATADSTTSFNYREFSSKEQSGTYNHQSSSEAQSGTYNHQSSSEEQSETHNHQDSSEAHTNQENSSHASNDEALFHGCTDKESLTKKYHDLMKKYHPDNPNGDLEMTQRIQNAYETLRKKYN